MKPTLLIVDDCAAARATLRALVENDFRVVGEARDGADALAQCRELSPDIVLMDAAMPRMSGIDATRLILESVTPRPCIVMVSGLPDESVALQAFEAGASDYLVKPVEGNALREVLHRLLKRAA